jgi:hypothetical protein
MSGLISGIVRANVVQNAALYAFAYFLPVILKDGFGYSTAKAQVMTFPPYLVGGVVRSPNTLGSFLQGHRYTGAGAD